MSTNRDRYRDREENGKNDGFKYVAPHGRKNPKQRDGFRAPSSPFIRDDYPKRATIRYSFEDLLNFYHSPTLPDHLVGKKDINSEPIVPWCLNPITQEELDKAWTRCYVNKSKPVHQKSRLKNEELIMMAVEVMKQMFPSSEKEVKEEVKEELVKEKEEKEEVKEEVKEVKEELVKEKEVKEEENEELVKEGEVKVEEKEQTEEVINKPNILIEQEKKEEGMIEETPRVKPVASPIDLGMYHVTHSLEPSVVIQQTASRESIPMSLEDVDHLLNVVGEETTEEERDWFYIDAQGFERGPFDSSTMRAWWDNGFLTQSLAVKYRDGSWRPIQSCYSSLENVFLEPPMEEMITKTAWKEPLRHSATDRRLPKTLVSVMKKREMDVPENSTQTETPVVTPPIPPKDAVSISTVLSLQQQTTEEELAKETKNETPYHPSTTNQIPALTLERDARKITLPVSESASESSAEPVSVPAPTPSTKPSKPIISPWTRQRLDQGALSPVDLATKMGWTIKENPHTTYESQQKPSSSYSDRIGTMVSTDEAKKDIVWNIPSTPAAVPLEQILREQQSEKKTVPVPKQSVATPTPAPAPPKKGKGTQWTRVVLSQQTSMRPVTHPAPSGKSFQEIMEEQKQQKQKKEQEKVKAKSGAWSTLFASNTLPVLGEKHEKPTGKNAAPANENQLFWEAAERKTKKELKEVPKTVSIDKYSKEEFDQWCRQQMMNLSGSDDISLLEFCFGLDDDQTLSYFQDYLGSSKAVLQFGKEFLRRKQSLSNSK